MTDMDYRSKTLNVPCTGEFKIVVDHVGWSITLLHNDGTLYVRWWTSEADNGVFVDMLDVFSTFTIPEWMWIQMMDDVTELTLALKHDSIHTPHTVQDYTQ
jgi:hypothetical protein